MKKGMRLGIIGIISFMMLGELWAQGKDVSYNLATAKLKGYFVKAQGGEREALES